MNGCDLCQRMKNRMKAPVGKLMVNKVPKRPQTYLIVDFITKLLLVVGKDVILIVCDRLSKIAHLQQLWREHQQRDWQDYSENMQKLYRLPESVILDRGPQFAVELTKELKKKL